MNVVIKVVVLFLAVAFVSCQNQASKPEVAPADRSIVEILRSELARLDLQDPEDDLQENLAKGDYRFIGIYGYTLFCPGAEELAYGQIEKYGIRPIKGTSDTVASKEHGQLIESATQYAKRYNQALIRKLNRGSNESHSLRLAIALAS